MIPLERLQTIAKLSPGRCCGETRYFIGAALSNNWNEEIMKDPLFQDYSNPKWTSINYCSKGSSFRLDLINMTDKFIRPDEIILIDLSKIINLIETTLIRSGYIGVSIDCDCSKSQNHIDHAFTICRTESGDIIIDSYIDERGVEIRPFDHRKDLGEFLKRPTLSLWNRIFNCKNDVCHKDCDIYIHLQLDIFGKVDSLS